MCVHKHANGRGVWGYARPGKFGKLDALRVVLRPLWPMQSGTTVIVVICASSYVVLRVQTSEFSVPGAGPQCSATQHSCVP